MRLPDLEITFSDEDTQWRRVRASNIEQVLAEPSLREKAVKTLVMLFNQGQGRSVCRRTGRPVRVRLRR